MAGMNWKRIKDAQVFGRGQYLKPGKYKLRLLKMFTIRTRKKGAALIVDFEVLESDNSEIKEGSTRNWYQGLADEDIAFPSIKEFMLRLFGYEDGDDEVEDFEEKLDELMDVCGDDHWKNEEDEDHPLHGKTIAVECYMKQTNKGNDFTVHNWECWSDEDDDDDEEED